MIFEQAFYTRETDKGLNVVASSDTSLSFKDKCLTVGSEFEIEPTDETAEFVYYSNAFGCYVGVGVSPSSFSDVFGKNKLVHIWVPKAKTNNPDEYYTQYVFERKVDKSKNYSCREFPAILSREDYSRILKKYELDVNRLASLLQSVGPLYFREKNFLAIDVSLENHSEEELPVIAREITWLLSQMIPALKEEKIELSKHLSYSVLSTTNVSAVNIAYVKDSSKFDNVYYLDHPKLDNISELYRILASKAVISYEKYQTFLEELYDCRIEKGINSESFMLMVCYWQMKSGAIANIKQKELPLSFETILKRSQNNKNYRDFIYLLCECVEDISARELALLHKRIFTIEQNGYSNSTNTEFVKAYQTMACKAFFTGNSMLYDSYMDISNEDLKKLIYQEMWDRNWESEKRENCIQVDIENIVDVKGLLNKIQYYKVLIGNIRFLEIIRNIVIDKRLYFQACLEERITISEYLSGTSAENTATWELLVREMVADYFNVEEAYIGFVIHELRRIENSYIAFYFTKLVEKCKAAENKATRERLQKVAHDFLKIYKQDVDDADFKDFNNLDLTWYRNDLNKQLTGISIEELARFNMFGDYISIYPHEAWGDWTDSVYARLKSTMCSDSEISLLISRKSDLPKEMYSSYYNAVWDNYYKGVRYRMGINVEPLEANYELNECVSHEKMFTFAELLEYDPCKPYFSEYERLLRSDWCDAVVARMDSTVPCDDYIKGLISKKDYISTVDQIKRKRYFDSVWDFCGDNLNWRMYCSYYLGVKEYSIWTIFDACDISRYDEIYAQTKPKTNRWGRTVKSGFWTIEETSLLDTGLIPTEFNRCCYLLWKQVKKEAKCDMSQLSTLGKIPIDSQSFLNFLNILQEEIEKSIGETAAFNYLLIEAKKDEEWTGVVPSTYETRCGLYRDLKKRNKTFYNYLIYTPESGSNEQVVCRLREIHVFEQLDSRNPVDEENLETSAALLFEAESVLGLQEDMVVRLRKEYDEVMGSIKEKQEDAQRRLDQRRIEKTNVENQIRELETKKRDLEKEINEATSDIDKLKNKIDKAKVLRQGKQDKELLKGNSQKGVNTTRGSKSTYVNAQKNDHLSTTAYGTSENTLDTNGNSSTNVCRLYLTADAAEY